MKRQSFVLTGAGALLAGCAAPALSPTNLGSTGTQPETVRRANVDAGAQLLGSLLLSPYDFIPRYFEPCHGQVLPIKSNLPLFSLLGARFGGDGQSTFGLPDMRNHDPIKGLAYLIATRGIYPERKILSPDYGNIQPLLGQISCVPYLSKYVPPSGWAACDGQLRQIDREVALYSLLGTKFGGDGKKTFALPDLRDHELKTGITYVIAVHGRFPLTQRPLSS